MRIPRMTQIRILGSLTRADSRRSAKNRTTRLRRPVRPLAAAPLIAALLSFSASPAVAQPDERTYTWNMQGASHATANKWNTGVTTLMQNCDVLALQEAGSVPSSAIQIGSSATGVARATGSSGSGSM